VDTRVPAGKKKGKRGRIIAPVGLPVKEKSSSKEGKRRVRRKEDEAIRRGNS